MNLPELPAPDAFAGHNRQIPALKMETAIAYGAACAARAVAVERERWTSLLEARMWSFVRSVLSQGTSIQQDYMAGKYPTYEHYSARLDEAGRERADGFSAALIAEAIRAEPAQQLTKGEPQ